MFDVYISAGIKLPTCTILADFSDACPKWVFIIKFSLIGKMG